MVDYFDADVAKGYDAEHGDADELEEIVNFLAALAGDRRALEFAIGTGRVALPLHARGIELAGIEISRAMIDEMRAKPTGDEIAVTIGDMATTRVEGSFALVFLVFNTIFNLTTQDAQVACFKNAAKHLEPGGHFVVDTFVPPLRRLPLGQSLLAFERSETHMGTDEYDTVTQQFISHHVWIRGDGTVQRSIPFRYAWPAELDLMARMAGMELAERWGDWMGSPFTSASARHVSVWRKA